MEDFLKNLAWVGPVLVLGLVYGLQTLRKYIEQKKAKEALAGHPDAENSHSDDEAPEQEELLPPEPPQPAPVHPLELASAEYEAMVRRASTDLKAREYLWGLAQQRAQVKAVENNEPTLLTLYPDGTYQIEEFPFNDVRRKDRGGDGSQAQLVVDDLRDLPIDECSEPDKFLPAHLREKGIAWLKRRQDAIRAGSFYAGDGTTSKKIAGFEKYRGDLNKRAEASFKDALVEIRADAERKAVLMMQKEERRKLIVAEATERDVSVGVIEKEFVDMVVKEAVNKANYQYREAPRTQTDGGPLAALTGDRIKNSSMFKW